MLKQDYNDYLEMLKTQADNSAMQTQRLECLEKVINSMDIGYGDHIDTYVPHYFSQQLQQMDSESANIMQKMVILQSAIDHWDDIFSACYDDSIVEQYTKTLSRILTTCQTDVGYSEGVVDVYWKDLAMAQRLMFPAGAQVVESSSGFSLKQGLRGNTIDALAFLWLNLRQGGLKGYYQIHTHTPDLAEFNPQGWNDCYWRIAQMLERNPAIKGIFGGSWFYDPQLLEISPRLAYLQQVPLENGASSFYTGVDHSGNAIFSSKTRRQLHEQGKYTPKSYLLIWPRTQMLNWAKRYRYEHQHQEVVLGVSK